jgi:chemotaxis protein MotB
MARRKHVEEHVNHERWLVSYADFITLLFAFFVVMYSISQINESKYRVLSNTLTDAFNQPELQVHPIQVGETAKSNPLNLVQLSAMAIKDKEGQGGSERDTDELTEQFKNISNKIEQALGDLIKQNMVTLRGNEQWLEIEMRSSLLFDSGDATLSNKALELLGQISEILREEKTPVRVEGFTDNVPIHSVRFPSNWELSSARAAAVVQLFIEEGLDPTQLMATGYGEFQPIAGNDTPEGRTKNRRVVLMISKTGELRPQLKEIIPEADIQSSQPSATAPTAQPLLQSINISPVPAPSSSAATPISTAAPTSAPAPGAENIKKP